MDNFMDKLAQKWNAGELIKANSAAEAMELRKLQEQVAEYEEILQEIRKLNLKNAELMESSRKLVEVGIGEVAAILQQKKEDGDYKQLVDEIINRSEEFVHKENVKVYRNVQAVVVDGIKEQTEELNKQNKISWESVKGLKLIIYIILILMIGNIGLTIAQILGLL